MNLCAVADCKTPHRLKKGLCRMHYMRVQRTGSTDDPEPRKRNTCSVVSCNEHVKGHEMCETHYMRWYRHGDVTITLRQRDTGPDEIRWLNKVSVEAPGCWLWSSGQQGHGYGAYSYGGKSIAAHIYVYQLLVGPVPRGLELDHLCRVRHCVNPDHLEPVTHLENTVRGTYGRGKPRPSRRKAQV